MVVVHYYEKNKELLNQLCTKSPAKGADIVLKGRKGKIVGVREVEGNKVRVDVELEVIRKVVAGADDKKKKR
ncbi:MAG: hypothetical protein ACI35O_09375 [Bacillaceae bacterium]